MAERQAADRPQIEIGVDLRVEALSIVFRVAGADEYKRGRVASYSASVDAYFAPFKDHSAVALVRKLRETDWISHDAVVKLAVHVGDVETFRENVSLDQTRTLGTRWRREAARDLLRELRLFAKESGFPRFFAQHEELYATTNRRLHALLEESDLLWLEEYFGAPTSRIEVVPGMLTGRTSYGATVVRNGEVDRYAIVGVERVDAGGLPVFDRTIIETIVHELCHSYINPVIGELADDLEDAGSALYLSQQPLMDAQFYRRGLTVMNETWTRACTHRYLQARGLPEEVDADLAYNRSRGFVWIQEVSGYLEIYEDNRETYRTFGDFAPELARLLSKYTRTNGRIVEAVEERRPRVVEVAPANGAIDVDPNTTVIKVTFDRPMRADSWSVVGGGPLYPETGPPSYDSARRVFRLPVQLEPEHEYELWLNRGSYRSFASEEGIALRPVRLRFLTGSGR